jgi:hypothetical protein
MEIIVKLIPKLNNSCFWVLGDGTDTDAWQHTWIQEGVRVIDQIEAIPTLMICKILKCVSLWMRMVIGTGFCYKDGYLQI